MVAAHRRSSAEVATLEVRASNEAAQQLYRSMGFETAGVKKQYYKNGEDALVMQLLLAQGRQGAEQAEPAGHSGR